MSKIPISVCIIAKNEEKHIEECLKRLKPYGFEIIVTDTGSTDRTRELAEKYADKVLDFEWINDFSAARNFCASHASNNWILVLDCDEYVNSIDVPVVRIMMQKFPRSVGDVRIKSITQNRGNTVYVMNDVSRFYNKNFYFFDSPIHEQLRSKDKNKWDDPINFVVLPMEVIHHGYNLTPDEMVQKQKRNLGILYKTLETNDKDSYLYFQAGQSEFMLGNRKQAIELYEKGLSYAESTECEYVKLMIMSLAKGYVKEGRVDDAVALMEKYLEECQTAKYIFTYANVMMDSGNTLKALVLYLKATMMPDSDMLGINLLHCYESIIKIYTDMGEAELAAPFREKYEACLKENERVVNS